MHQWCDLDKQKLFDAYEYQIDFLGVKCSADCAQHIRKLDNILDK